MDKLVTLVVYIVGFILLLAGEVITVLTGLILKLAIFAFSKVSGRHSARLTALTNSLLLLRKRQEAAESVAIPSPIQNEASHETNDEPEFKVAKIHTRKFQGGSVRVVLYEYPDMIRRSAWIPVRNGKRGKVPRRFEMSHLDNQPISKAWFATKADLAELMEKINESRTRKSRPVQVASTQQNEINAQAATTVAPVVEQSISTAAQPEKGLAPSTDAVTTPQGDTLSAKKLARPVEWIGKVMEFGHALRVDVTKPYDAFRVKLVSELGTVEDVWGADLARSFKESGVQSGEKVHIRFVGKRPVPIPDGEGNIITREKNVYEVRRLAH